MARAKLVLEDGTVFEGQACGAEGERQGEVVFNTAMTGYQEILTDPSYKGQIVVMTYTQIGNYGVNPDDVESCKPWVEGFVARELSRVASNWRANMPLDEYLKKNDIVAIEGIDTRALTRKLRIHGAMNGVLSTTDLDDRSLAAKAKKVPSMVGQDLVKYVTRKEPAHWTQLTKLQAPPPKYRVALVDCGVKLNILRLLVLSGCDVTVYPAQVDHRELEKYDGVVLSNGPGDPSVVTYVIETARQLMKRGQPTFGICLGHQILGAALGAKILKLKFGHHGANHPVKNLETGAVEITSQNHGFAVDPDSMQKQGGVVTHINLNDQSVEGFRHRSLPIFSVQFHPEASPGPHDSRYLFDSFKKAMDTCRKG